MTTKISNILATHGPSVGLRDNSTQRAYADFVQAGIEAARASTDPNQPGGQLFAEAETGSGKTIGYLVAAGMDCVQHGSRAIIATHTLGLQRQALSFLDNGQINPACDMAKALAIVEAQTGKRLTAALRVGRRNFVDAKRCVGVVQRVLKRRNLSDESIAALEDLARWAQEYPGGEFRDFLVETGMDALPENLAQEDLCIDTSTDRKGPSYAAYAAHATGARNADIVVTNHAMLVRQALSRRTPILSGEDDPRPIGVIVVDECDQLESAARSASSDLLPLREIKAALIQWNNHSGDGRGDAGLVACNVLLDDMKKRIGRIDNAAENQEAILFWEDISRSERQGLMDKVRALGTALSPLMAAVENINDPTEKPVREYAQTLANIYISMRDDMAEKIPGKKANVIALRWSPSREYPSFRLFRLHPARILKTLWATWVQTTEDRDVEPNAQAELYGEQVEKAEAPQRARALILTSATISAPTQSNRADVSQLSDVFGVYPPANACDALNRQGMMFSPKKYGSVKIVFSDAKAPPVYLGVDEVDFESGDVRKPLNPAWVNYNVKIVQRAQEQGGRMLVLTNSYAATAAIAQALRAAGIEPIEKTKAVSQQFCVRRLVEDPNRVFISPGSWEGFDISQYTGPNGKPAKLKHVLMTQLPFTRVDGPFTKALKQHLVNNRGIDPQRAEGVIYGNIRAAAMRRAKQGFGRGIRGLQDSFTFWVGDPRFPRSPVFHEPAAKNSGVRVQSGFSAIVPKRFRTSGMTDSAWDAGSVLRVDGRLVTLTDLRETMGV